MFHTDRMDFGLMHDLFNNSSKTGTLIHHRLLLLLLTSSIHPHPVSMISSPFGTPTMTSPCCADGLLPRSTSAPIAAVPMPSVTRTANVEWPPATPTLELKKSPHQPEPTSGQYARIEAGSSRLGLSRAVRGGSVGMPTPGPSPRTQTYPAHRQFRSRSKGIRRSNSFWVVNELFVRLVSIHAVFSERLQRCPRTTRRR